MHLHYCSDHVLSNTPSQAGSPALLVSILIYIMFIIKDFSLKLNTLSSWHNIYIPALI